MFTIIIIFFQHILDLHLYPKLWVLLKTALTLLGLLLLTLVVQIFWATTWRNAKMAVICGTWSIHQTSWLKVSTVWQFWIYTFILFLLKSKTKSSNEGGCVLHFSFNEILNKNVYANRETLCCERCGRRSWIWVQSISCQHIWGWRAKWTFRICDCKRSKE